MPAITRIIPPLIFCSVHPLLVASVLPLLSGGWGSGSGLSGAGRVGGVAAAFVLKMSTAGRGETRKPAVVDVDPVEVESTKTLSLGGRSLRRIVTDAAVRDLEKTDGDLRGIAWFEHLNLVVGSRRHAERFYVDFLGFTPDASRSFHVNLGRQQFHLAEVAGEPAQIIAGSVGLAVPNLDDIRDRVEVATEALGGTEFRVLNDDVDEGGHQCLTVSCPWGNIFHLYDIRDDDKRSTDVVGDLPPSSKKMVNLHREGGTYGPNRMAIMGGPGIRYVEIRCRRRRGGSSTPAIISGFYENMIGCTVSTHTLTTSTDDDASAEAVAVCVGPGVHFVYVEDEEDDDGGSTNPPRPLTESDEEAMRGVHACVYVHDFKGLYERLSSRGLVWTNPRFAHLDTCDTWEEAWESRTLRFRYVVDLDDDDGGDDGGGGGSGGAARKVLELEHETRPLRHGQYMKVPRYEPR